MSQARMGARISNPARRIVQNIFPAEKPHDRERQCDEKRGRRVEEAGFHLAVEDGFRGFSRPSA